MRDLGRTESIEVQVNGKGVVLEDLVDDPVYGPGFAVLVCSAKGTRYFEWYACQPEWLLAVYESGAASRLCVLENVIFVGICGWVGDEETKEPYVRARSHPDVDHFLRVLSAFKARAHKRKGEHLTTDQARVVMRKVTARLTRMSEKAKRSQRVDRGEQEERHQQAQKAVEAARRLHA